MFEKELKVLDCTIHDGGHINNYQFSPDFVKKVWQATCDAAVDIVELGRIDQAVSTPRQVRYLELLRRRRSAAGYRLLRMRIDRWWRSCSMSDAWICANCSPSKAPVDMIRVACCVHQIDAGLDLVKRCKDLGYLTTMNVGRIRRHRNRIGGGAAGDRQDR